ncbi:MAG: hypothetical protein FWF88_07180 [Peptococcaceae bacterium]|nr:hypothetical protein [Peptococcaceae bacterium]
MRKKLAIMAFAAVMMLSLVPVIMLAAFPGEGNVPIPGAYGIDSSGQSTAAPAELSPGQIWTNKNVVDQGNGTFEITLYAWGATFIDEHDINENGDTTEVLNPLPDSAPNISFMDSIGVGFEYNGDADQTVVYDGIDNTVTWVVSQSNILGGAPFTCTFTVSLKTGWEVETPYETNKSASAAFTPLEGNPYYWSIMVSEEADLSEIDISWNNGSQTGFNRAHFKDLKRGLEFLEPNGNFPPFTVTAAGGSTRTFTFDSSRTNSNFLATFDDKGNITNLPANLSTAADGTFGDLWSDTMVGGYKFYYIWFMGLEGPGVLTIYEIKVDNPGGNSGVPGHTYTIYKDYTRKTGFNWQTDGSIKDPLPNKGVIELTYILREITFTKIDGNRYVATPSEIIPLPGAEFAVFELTQEGITQFTSTGTLVPQLVPADVVNGASSAFWRPYDLDGGSNKASSGANGLVTLNLGEGYYMLIETKAPQNGSQLYMLPQGQWFFEVALNASPVAFQEVAGTNGLNPPAFADSYRYLVNYQQHDLPATGGAGTAIFIGLGSLFMIGGTALLAVFQRRVRKVEA